MGEILDRIKSYIITLVCTKEFIIGFITGFFVAGGIFSHWIFGSDNLWEQTLELIIRIVSGHNIDITQ